MVLAINGSPVTGTSSGSSWGLTYSASAGDVVVLQINLYGNDPANFPVVASLSDAAGYTWHRRRQTKYVSNYVGAGSTASARYITQEIWWANTTGAVSAQFLTINVTNSAKEQIGADAVLFRVSGSTTPSAPWDGAGGLQTYSDNTGALTTAINPTGTTAQTNDMVLGFLQAFGSVANSTTPAVGSGFTSVSLGSKGTTPDFIYTDIQFQLQAASGAIAAPWTNNKQEYVAVVDALSGTATGNANDMSPVTGTATTALTKASNSVAGKFGIQLSGTPVISGSAGNVSSVATTFSNDAAHTTVIAYIVTQNRTGGGAASSTVNSVADTNGLTWHKRGTIGAVTAGVMGSNVEVWYAVAAAQQTSNTVTATLSSANSQAQISVFSVKNYFGATSGSLPFFAGGLAGTQYAGAGGTVAANISAQPGGASPASANNIVLNFVADDGQNAASTPSTAGSSALFTASKPGSFDVCAQYIPQYAVANTTPTWSGQQKGYIAVTDVLDGGPTVSGTVTTTLTKASMVNTGKFGITLSGTPVSANSGASSVGTIAATFSDADPGCIIVAMVTLENRTNSTASTVSSIADTNGLTWTKRGGTGRTTNTFPMRQEIWWAYASAQQTSNTVTATLSDSASAAHIGISCWRGSPNINAPFNEGGIGGSPINNGTGASNASLVAVTGQSFTQTGLHDVVLSMAVTDGSGSAEGASSGTSLWATRVNAVWDAVAQYANTYTTGTDATSFSTTQKGYQTIVDALSGNIANRGTITTALTKANISAAAVEGVPILHGTPVQTIDTTGAVSSLAATITTTVPTVVIAVIDTYNFVPSGAIRTVTGVSGGGLTWAKRSGTSGQNGTSFSLNQEVWWANATGALTAQAITASFSGVVSQNSAITVFAVAGSPNPASPWDTNVSLPATTSKMNSGTTTTMTKSATVTSVKSMLLGFAAYAWNNHTASTTPTGYIDIKAPYNGTSLNVYNEYAPTGTGAVSVSWVNGQEFWQVTLDALTGDPPSPTGTISTTLTKASISAAGTVTTARVTTALTKVSQSAAGAEIFTGTISTALTKASLSAAGWASAKGTIATSLTKISQVLSGADIATAGTITTRLAKASQTVSATEKFIANTVTTSLRKPSQAGAGWTTVSGSAVTALRGISQFSVPDPIAIQATEIFTGTIVTNIDVGAGIAIHASTYEIFTGSIATRLTRANFAAIAEEDFIGHAVTRLGSSSGNMVATVVQALEIIQGPVVTVLPPFRPLILGAMLGQPGGGSWFSWRYTDA